MRLANRGENTFTALNWVQKITFPKFQFRVLENVNKIIPQKCSTMEAIKILDVGCFKGYASSQYVKEAPNAKLYGIDWRDKRDDEFIPRFSDFKATDLEKDQFPFEDEYFDIIVSNQVFEHLKNIYMPLSEIRRVLRPDGLFYFSVPNLASLHNRILLSLGQQPSTIRSMGSHVRGFTLSESKQLLSYENLFKIISVKGVGLSPVWHGKLFGFLKTFGHTTVILAQKRSCRNVVDWMGKMTKSGASSNYFSGK